MKTLFPQGGWDVHHHIFEPERFPYSPDRHLTPPPATVERYNKFKAKLGLTNSVLTHGLTYGTDCTCLSSCISELGANVTRGIGVIDPKTVTPKQLQEMHDSGVRGIRVNLYHYSAMHDLELQKMVLREHAQAIKSQFPAWTMAFTHLHPEFWAELKPIITQEIVPLGGRIVTDHFALLKGASMLPPKLKGDILLQEGFQDLLDLVRDGSLYIKISAPYRVSKEAPEFNDLRPLVRAFIDANPQQVLWGSDWPHTPLMSVRSREEALTESSYLEVDDLAWLNSLRNWLSDDEWQQVMVLNPRRLYGV
ncbi:hypothetical protein ASPSYDRAFT_204007 [Aspergillus sydowii CBS 593.65]|uniref:Amidohydrolase-related domain-containing protein n=1 Tax=Aspergillus sydowii CBS 593.65 TaxID=1036612 RepID=A0A1L9TFA7_9EURO|nr:uncharacterized protein ASPSYDRAFT_204007 [Aspergillus sydowii CBS 593.65]OJJ58092.1 hypothetical protein ASPSYDRAFT_204007 [Aspergillus sydowii CBS 593.65]